MSNNVLARTHMRPPLSFFVLLALISISRAPAQVCPPLDIPDPLFQDINLDGIDGDTAGAIFVSVVAGSDLNSGSRLAPVATLEHAISLASAVGKDVYVAAGVYSPASTLNLNAGVSLFGMYDGPPFWNRSSSNVTVVNGRSTAVLVQDTTGDVHIEGFTINAANATGSGQSSYGIRVVNCSGIIFVRNNQINAGNGTSGIGGASGTIGNNGGNGSNGKAGSCDGSHGPSVSGGISTCGRTGGFGGAGGPEGNNSGQNGGTGVGGTPGGIGGPGCDGGFGSCTGGDGTNGTAGANGSNGSNGSTGATIGIISGGLYLPANGGSGTNGAPGNGGGGGGGGGGQAGFAVNDGGGNGGGAGGGGGCGGTLGAGGQGGGGSFGIVVVNAKAIVRNNQITTFNGGTGGAGGGGAIGGTGGNGGFGGAACPSEVGVGGNGGKGGDGGVGGNGAGGTGGPSIGVFIVDTADVEVGGNSITTGSAGLGGSGGFNGVTGNGPTGLSGISTAVRGIPTTVSLPTPLACISDVMISEPSPGTTNAVFTLYLSSPFSSSVNITYSTEDGSALNGEDYDAASGNVTFAAGQVIAFVNVPVKSDFVEEGDENFALRLTGATNATISDSIGSATIFNSTISRSVDVNAKWNLVSLPLIVSSHMVDSVFPTASSSLFAYSSGYTPIDSMRIGAGYWLKFAASHSFPLVGFHISEETLSVEEGWNLIGGLTDSIPIGSVTANPPGLITSPWYGYEGSYNTVSSLTPGKGYWAKAETSGTLILSSTSAAFGSSTLSAAASVSMPASLGQLRFVDASGPSQTLYFGRSPGNVKNLPSFELPPLPPDGGFDVRFASGLNSAFLDGQISFQAINLMSSGYPLLIHWTADPSVLAAQLRIDDRSISLRGEGSALIHDTPSSLVLMLDTEIEKPKEFALDQNYPNPFNPSTTIRYALPFDAHVFLTVFDILGRKVQTLVDGIQEAGYRSVMWNANSTASGMYFYRMEVVSIQNPADTFVQVRRMLLMK